MIKEKPPVDDFAAGFDSPLVKGSIAAQADARSRHLKCLHLENLRDQMLRFVKPGARRSPI